MAIQMRRGNYADFNPAKMVAGEFGICLDNGYVYIALAPGNCVRLGTAETIEEALEMARSYVNDCKTYSEDSESFSENSEAWAVGKRDGKDVPSTDATYHNNAKYYSDYAQTFSENAQYIYLRYSKYSDGTSFVTVPTDETVYMGIYIGHSTTAPIRKTDYNWVRFIGRDGEGVPSWEDVTEKPFNTLNSNDFTVTDNELSLEIPTYYKTIKVAPTSANPLSIPNMKTPCKVIVEYDPDDKSKNTTISLGSVLYINNASYKISTAYANSTTYTALTVSLYYRYANPTTGKRTVELFIPKNDAIAIANNYQKQYTSTDFLKKNTSATVDTNGYNIPLSYGSSYLLCTYEYNATTLDYYQQHVYLITQPNVDGAVPISTTVGGSSTTGVTLGLTSGNLNIRARTSTYMVKFTLFDV